MTPAARTQAAIELLQDLAARPRPLDRLVAGYFRRRRYAGAKDRAAITELVYGVLRQRAHLLWHHGADVPPRLLVAAYLQEIEGLQPGGLAGRFDGSRYGPAMLDGDELACVARPVPAEPPPDWVRGNYPAWLDDELTRSLGAAKLAELAAYNERAPLDLRVNTLKADRDQVLAALRADGLDAVAGAWSPWAVRLPTATRIERHELYLGGQVEIQDEASQLIALLSDTGPGQAVADLCAGAGGKTLALAAMLAGQDDIVALDADPRRLAQLAPRLARAGAGNVTSRPLGGLDDPWLRDMAGRFDRVLIDAPCSGTGTWRRNPDARWRLTPGDLAGYVTAQQALLRAAAPLVAPGGRLVYATCSFLRSENEDQVATFLAQDVGFEVLPVPGIWRRLLDVPPPAEAPYLRLSPANHGTDGFFLAVLGRRTAA